MPDLMETTAAEAAKFFSQTPGLSKLVERNRPLFLRRYETAQQLTQKAQELRANMPVIEQADHDVLKRLLRGHMRERTIIMYPEHMRPLQREMHLEKLGDAITQHGFTGAVYNLTQEAILVSQDHHIVDGHHHWLLAMLVDHSVAVCRCNLPAEALLVLALGLSDREHHMRNM